MTSETFICFSPKVFVNLRLVAQPYAVLLPYPICRIFATALDFFPLRSII
ncbi:hypothetical protein HMPREF1546_01190 [Oscillibacter sp. KLE 1745]|nr:hypothetical protein HMPREF1546_01190 [Oscillibacter sp. KLE 1745]